MRRPFASILAASLCLPALATAQPGVAPSAVPVTAVPAVPVAPPATAPLAEPITAPTPPKIGIDKRSADDAAANRAYFARSALIAPRGTVSLDARAPTGPVAMLGIDAALTDRIELGIATILVPDDASVFGFHAKVQLLHGDRYAIAAGFDYFNASDDNEHDDRVLLPSLNGSFCTDGDACNTLLNLHLTGIQVDDDDEMPILGGVSIVTGKKNKLVIEAHATQDEESGDTAFGGYIGGRFGGAKLAFDAGLAIGGYSEGNTDCGDCSTETEIAPFPFLGLSARL